MSIADAEKFDALIVGAGPAGSSLAIRLAMAGRRVLLIDRDQFPRHKMCGEFVSPECIGHLQELRVWRAIAALTPPKLSETHFYSRNAKRLRIDNQWLAKGDTNAIGLSRYELDKMLLDRARECGVTILERSIVRKPVVSGQKLNGFVIQTDDGNEIFIRSKIAIDATGRSRALARQFGFPTPKRDNDQVAFKAHFRGSAIAENVCEMFSFPGGYGGCLQVENEAFNVCYVVSSARVRTIGNDRDEIFRETFLQNRRAAEVLSTAERTTDWLSVSIGGYGRFELSPFPGVLAIGDSAGFIDPFTGSGIALAFQTSKLCSEAIVEEKSFEAILKNYERRYSAVLKNRMRFCAVLRRLSRLPNFADRMIESMAYAGRIAQFAAKATRVGTVN